MSVCFERDACFLPRGSSSRAAAVEAPREGTTQVPNLTGGKGPSGSRVNWSQALRSLQPVVRRELLHMYNTWPRIKKVACSPGVARTTVRGNRFASGLSPTARQPAIKTPKSRAPRPCAHEPREPPLANGALPPGSPFWSPPACSRKSPLTRHPLGKGRPHAHVTTVAM